MKEEKYIELIAQLLSGEISESDKSALMDWVDADAKNQALFNETMQLWEVTENYESDFDTNVNDAWGKVESQLAIAAVNEDSSGKIIRLSNFKRILQIAAVFLIALASWLWFSQTNEPQLFAYQTIEEEKLDIYLPDSSRVVLNENSQLTFIEMEGKRMVTLEGEAWFDVKHLDSVPFEILSGEARTTVLGTAFNVRAYPMENKIEVSVERGKVAFSKKENITDFKILEAGTEGAFYKKENTVKKEIRETDNANSWRTMTIHCDNIKLDKVFETMERYFEVDIEVADPTILNCSLFGSYENPDFEFLKKFISEALGYKFVKKGNVYMVSGEGCPENN